MVGGTVQQLSMQKNIIIKQKHHYKATTYMKINPFERDKVNKSVTVQVT